MNPLWLAILMQTIAAVVIIVEIIVPSGGLLGILATGIIVYSLYHVFTEMSLNAGYTLLVADIVLLPALILLGLKLLVRSPATLRTELSSRSGVTSQSPEMEAYVGKNGVAVTDLRPAGIAVIDGKRIDVVSQGLYIDKNAAVLVTAVSGNRVVVVEIE